MKTSSVYIAILALLANTTIAMPNAAEGGVASNPHCVGPANGEKFGNKHKECESKCYGDTANGHKCKGKCLFQNNNWTCELNP